MKRIGQNDPGFDFPALVGRGIDVAKESLAKWPGLKPASDKLGEKPVPFGAPLFPQPWFGKDSAFPFFADKLPADKTDLSPKPFLPPKPLLPDAQKLVTDFRAYSGIRHREAVPQKASVVLGRLGPLEVRLARTARDVRRAQRLRYKVFYEEMAAVPDAATRLARRDMDSFDTICDHILVLDHDAGKIVLGRRKPKVVGTYRLLRGAVAAAHAVSRSLQSSHLSGIRGACRCRKRNTGHAGCSSLPHRRRLYGGQCGLHRQVFRSSVRTRGRAGGVLRFPVLPRLLDR